MTRRDFLTMSRKARNEQLRAQITAVLLLTLAASLWVVAIVLLAEKPA